MTIRFISYILLIFISFLLPFWAFVAGVIVYGVFFTSYELLILAVCVDAIFGEAGSGNIWYLYTLTASVVILCIAYVKPYMRNSLL